MGLHKTVPLPEKVSQYGKSNEFTALFVEPTALNRFEIRRVGCYLEVLWQSGEHPLMSCTELTLVDHQNSMEKLKASMTRVGASMLPADFIRAVSNAYHEVEAPRHAVDMHAYFRSSGGAQRFCRCAESREGEFPWPGQYSRHGVWRGIRTRSVARDLYTIGS